MATSPKPRPWGKFVLLGCLVVPVVVCGGGLLVVKGQIAKRADRLPAEIAKLKALGVPTEPADLAPDPPISDDRNAAELYSALGYQLEAVVKEESKKGIVKLLDTFSSPAADSGKLAKVLQAVQDQQSILADADKLALKPDLDFHRDFRKGLWLLFPEYAEMKRLTKWQCARAKTQWMTGNQHAALISIKNAYRISEHAGQEPNLLAQLVCLATCAIAHRTLDQFIVEVRNDPQMLKQVDSMLTSLHTDADMRKAFEGEVVLGRQTIQGLRGAKDLKILMEMEGSKSPLNAAADLLLNNPRVRQALEAKFCEAWRKFFERAKGSNRWPDMAKAMATTGREVEADHSLDNTLSRIMFPVLGQAFDAVGKQVAERRLAFLSIRLLQMRDKGLPSDLKSLGSIAIDPYTNRPMGYEHKGRAFRVWSVGVDRKDNGGVIRKTGATGNRGFDIVMGFDMPIRQVEPLKGL